MRRRAGERTGRREFLTTQGFQCLNGTFVRERMNVAPAGNDSRGHKQDSWTAKPEEPAPVEDTLRGHRDVPASPFNFAGLTPAASARIEVLANGCWNWTGRIHPTGYGQLTLSRAAGHQTKRAHRYVYEQLVGPIPEGMHLDHLCHTRNSACKGNTCPHRRCVNPEHLQPVTPAENAIRGRAGREFESHCKHGHAFDESNTGYKGGRKPRRYCRACTRAADKRRRAGRVVA